MNFQTRFETLLTPRKSHPEQEISYLFPGSIFQLLELSVEGRSVRTLQHPKPGATFSSASRAEF